MRDKQVRLISVSQKEFSIKPSVEDRIIKACWNHLEQMKVCMFPSNFFQLVTFAYHQIPKGWSNKDAAYKAAERISLKVWEEKDD